MHVSTVSTCGIPWILQKLLFLHTSFWQEGFLNISNHLPDSSFALLANLTWLTLWSLLTAVLDDTFTHFGGFFSSFMVSWLLNLIETRRVSFWLISTVSTLQIPFKLLKLNNLSCLNQSSWWLCRRLTKSTTPWRIKSGPNTSN